MKYDGLILLVDDQPAAAADSVAALENYASPEQILYAGNAQQAIHILETRRVSLIFLDIEMPETDGFALAAYLEKEHRGIPYVFLTGHVDFAAESYDYEPVDFITKPVDVERLERTFEKVFKKETVNNAERVAVRTGQEYTLINPRSIRCFYKERRKIWMEFKDGNRCQVSSSMDELEQIFTEYGFFRCHQSFLIPIGDVISAGSGMFGQTYEAVIDGDIRVPVSRGKYTALRKELEISGIPFVRRVCGNPRGGNEEPDDQ